MKKRILSMLLVLALVLTMIPASALAETINDDNVFLMQSGSGKCTLTSAVMMLRRRAIIDGNADWESITESTLGSVAWINGSGMRYCYSYKEGNNWQYYTPHYDLFFIINKRAHKLSVGVFSRHQDCAPYFFSS